MVTADTRPWCLCCRTDFGLCLTGTEPELPTNPKQQFVDVVLLQRTVTKSGKAIRRLLNETGVLADVRTIADRFMRERGGDGQRACAQARLLAVAHCW